MAEPNVSPYPVAIVDNGGQLRLEVRYSGNGMPPWWGEEMGPRRSIIDAAAEAARGTACVTHVHEGLTTSNTLRLFVNIPRNCDKESVKQALTGAVLDVFTV